MLMNSLHRGLNSAATLLLSATLGCAAAAQDESSEMEITPPEDWYQVEVILFTQQGNLGGETPPKEYSTEFPDNWLELVDPNMPVVGKLYAVLLRRGLSTQIALLGK